LYFAVIVSVPDVKVVASEADAPAGAPGSLGDAVPAVPVTATGLPSWVDPAKNETVPFGAAPSLDVETVAISVTSVPEATVIPAEGDETLVVVDAEETVTFTVCAGLSEFVVPELKLGSLAPL